MIEISAACKCGDFTADFADKLDVHRLNFADGLPGTCRQAHWAKVDAPVDAVFIVLVFAVEYVKAALQINSGRMIKPCKKAIGKCGEEDMWRCL